MIEITKEEYAELMLIKWKFEKLKAAAKRSTYQSDVERMMFELDENGGEDDE